MYKETKEDMKFLLFLMCYIFIPAMIVCALYQAVVIGSPEDRYETKDCLVSSLKVTQTDYGVKIRGFISNKSNEDWNGADIVCDVYQNEEKIDTIRIFIGSIDRNGYKSMRKNDFFYKYECDNSENITAKIVSVNYVY